MIANLTPSLYLSGANEVRNIDELKRLGIDAILNVAWEETDPNYKDFLMVKISIHEFEHNPDFFLSMAVTILDNLISNGHTVLVHCHAGAHRGPYVAFRYLAEKERRTIEEIYNELTSKIPWKIIYPFNIK